MFFFGKGSNVRVTVPSRSIEDIKLPEIAYKADFELSNLYSEFSKEITKFSLLGIAGYGFIIEKIAGNHMRDMARGSTLALLVFGLACLVGSAGLGLYCGYLNRACLFMQVTILRLLQRRESARWTDPALSSAVDVYGWRIDNEKNLQDLRNCQAANLALAHKVQITTVWILIFGLIATAGIFLRCLDLNTPASKV